MALRQFANCVTIFLVASVRTLARKKRAGKLARVLHVIGAVFAALRAVQFCNSRAVRIPMVTIIEDPNDATHPGRLAAGQVRSIGKEETVRGYAS